jgi:hypothetical protein
MNCLHCKAPFSHPIALAEHEKSHSPQKSSITRDRSRHKPHDPIFRRGDYVIRATDWINKTGVRPNTAAKLVCDIEPDPRGREFGWHVGLERGGVHFIHESELCLLEEIEDHEAKVDNLGVTTWIKTIHPAS